MEAGQSAGLIDDLLPAAEVMRRLVEELEAGTQEARIAMTLLIENRGAVRILTMNRPDKRNALNHALTQALLDALRAADADEASAPSC